MIFKATDAFPFTSPETWRSRGWLLVRKIARNGATTTNDRRVAMLLLRHTRYTRQAFHADLRTRLELIAYGAHSAATHDASPREGMGPTDRDHEPSGE